MRFLIFFTFWLGLVQNAHAAPIEADLFHTSQINGPYTFAGPCYCQDAYATGFFAVRPGSIVDFGTITIVPVTASNHYGYPASFVSFDLIENTDLTNPIYYSSPLVVSDDPLPSQTFDLTHVIIPDDTYFIQFSWLGDANYVSPAVPEPSTWAMVMLGFIGVGLFARQHRKRDFVDYVSILP